MYNRKIDDLRAFLTKTLYDYEYEKINSSDNEFADRLKMICYFIDEKIKTTIEYYQYNKAPITEIEKAKDKCKDLSILLNKYKIELTKLGINTNEQLSFKKEVNDAFDFELTENTKELLPNYLEIEKEFLDFISNENDINSIDNLNTKELPQQINNSETLKDFVFKNNFDKVKENTIIEYFKTNLVEKKYISETVLNDFLSLAFDKKTLPIQKFSFEKLNTQNDIVQIFYNYYKTTAGKPYGKQKEYLNLLCNYFNGFENFNIKNFSK